MKVEGLKEEKKKTKGKERLVRFIILVLVVLLVIGVVRFLAGQQSKPEFDGLSLKWPIREKIETLGENVLGTAAKLLPGAPDLGEIKGEQINQVNQETEPIKQPTENIKKQTESLLKMIKELPQDQIEAIKKQIHKDFCEKLLEEEENE